jgi:MFS family permease
MAGIVCLMRIRPLLYLLIAGILVTAAQSGLAAFATPFLMRVHHLGIGQAGFALGIAQLLGGYAGVLTGGVLTDRVSRRSPDGPALITAAMISLAAPLAITALLLDNWTIAMVVWTGQLFLNFCYYGPHFATYMNLSPPKLRGTVVSIQMVLMTLVGYGVGPVLAGSASDLFRSYGVEDPLRWGMVVTAAIFAIAGCFYFAAARAIRRA